MPSQIPVPKGKKPQVGSSIPKRPLPNAIPKSQLPSKIPKSSLSSKIATPRNRNIHSQPTAIPLIEPRTSFLSPKAVWSDKPIRQIPKYQLSDPGPVSRLPVPTARRRVASTGATGTPPLNVSKIPRASGIPRASVGSRTSQQEKGSTLRDGIALVRGEGGISGIPKPVYSSVRTRNTQPLDGRRSIVSPVGANDYPTAGGSKRVDLSHTSSIAIRPNDAEDSDSQEVPSADMELENTPTMTSRQNSSTSSIYSSASSLARSRALRQAHLRTPSLSSTKTHSTSSSYTQANICAPYLVPPSQRQEDITLTWEPDPEAGYDEAEVMWRKLEGVMGGNRRGSSIRERGRWVVREKEGVEMERGFSLSDYYGVEGMEEEEGEMEEEEEEGVLFGMKGPLIVGGSGGTPRNTPIVGGIMRAGRVRRSRSGDEHTSLAEYPSKATSDGHGRYDHSPLADHITLSEGEMQVSETEKDIKIHMDSPMYRLDSHIISALMAFQNQPDQSSPALDYALSLSSSPVSIPGLESPLGGLGLGMGIHIRSDSIYGLNAVSKGREVEREEKEKGRDWWIRDLDTGEVTDVFAA